MSGWWHCSCCGRWASHSWWARDGGSVDHFPRCQRSGWWLMTHPGNHSWDIPLDMAIEMGKSLIVENCEIVQVYVWLPEGIRNYFRCTMWNSYSSKETICLCMASWALTWSWFGQIRRFHKCDHSWWDCRVPKMVYPRVINQRNGKSSGYM